jgi:hypothetical protein
VSELRQGGSKNNNKYKLDEIIRSPLHFTSLFDLCALMPVACDTTLLLQPPANTRLLMQPTYKLVYSPELCRVCSNLSIKVLLIRLGLRIVLSIALRISLSELFAL